MSERLGNTEAKNALLKKKTSRKKKPLPKLEKDFDIKRFKDKMFNELAAENSTIRREEETKSPFDYISEYDKKYKEYLQEGLTYNTLMFVNRIIMESTTLPPGIRTNFALHKMLYNIVKTLMMNELEVVYLSLFLDKMGWQTEGYQIDENLLITGISVKMYLNTNYGYIIEHLSKKMKIEERFNTWLNKRKDYSYTMTIAPRELNERFKLLSKPVNTYCKQNYIDHNFIVDQILQMSLPYSEQKANQDKLGTGSHEHTHTYEPPTLMKQNEVVHQKTEQNPMGTQNMNFFSSSLNEVCFDPRNYMQKQEAAKQMDIFAMNDNKPGLNPMNNFYDNNSINLGGPSINLGRIDSFKNMMSMRDPSYYVWDNADNKFLAPSRMGSQLFAQYPDDEDGKNIFSKNNAFRNMSVQSVSNELALNHTNSYLNANIHQPYPPKNQNLDTKSNMPNGDNVAVVNQIIPLVKEESEVGVANFNNQIDNRSFSFEKAIKSEAEPAVSEQAPAKNSLKLMVSEDSNKTVNLFKKMKEEQQNSKK